MSLKSWSWRTNAKSAIKKDIKKNPQSGGRGCLDHWWNFLHLKTSMSIMHSWEILHFTEFSITCVLLSLSLFCLETNHELPIKLFGCSIVLHCVLHVGLQYWSIMHSCEISHFTTVCCMLGRSIVLRCVLHVWLHYCNALCVACWPAVLYCTQH